MVPASEEDEAPTPKGKRRKKGEAPTSLIVVPAPLADEEICSSAMKSKQWKKLHFIGRHDIDPCVIRDPAEVWRARDRDEEHIQALKKSFQMYQKMNSKGLRLVLQNDEMWEQYEATDEEQKKEVFAPGSDFFKHLSGFMNWQPFTGDHTRSAAVLLKEALPSNPKWQMFQGVKFYLAGHDTERDDMLRTLGT